MAYGFDIEEIYYTGHDLVDIGILDTYDISLDVADEKDFQIVSPSFDIPVGGFWYVPDTEYGGIIGGRGVNSDDGDVTYTGMGWRGILHEHYIMLPDNADTRVFNGEIDELVTGLIEECGLSDLFVVDEMTLAEGVDSYVDDYTIKRGTTLYEAIIGLANNIIFTYLFEFRAKDKKVHITPTLANDYTEYMVYSNIGAVDYEMEEDHRVPNHYCMTSVNKDDHTRRTIHLFTDEDGDPQPHLLREPTPEKPTKDEDYIKDTRSQVLFGVDEVMLYEEVDDSVDENYEVVDEAPVDWDMTFGQYYKKDFDEETGEPEYTLYEAEDGEEPEPTYTRLTSSTAPADWNTNYSSYFTATWSQEEQKYVYNPVSGTTEFIAGNQSKYKPVYADGKIYANGIQHKEVKKTPTDWVWNYGEYYYYFWNGSAYVPTSFSSETKNTYKLTTAEPDDWATNYGNYYIHAKKVVTGKGSKKKEKYIDTKVGATGKWYNVEGVKKDKKTVAPKWVKNKYYVQIEGAVKIPKFKKGNTFHLPTVEKKPKYVANQFFSMYQPPAQPVIPTYVQGQVYRQVYDHYSHMIEDMLSYFEENKKTHTEKYTMDDFSVNIGDLVGARNEFTGEVVPAVKVSNLNVKIDNGLLSVEYVIEGG